MASTGTGLGIVLAHGCYKLRSSMCGHPAPLCRITSTEYGWHLARWRVLSRPRLGR
jgi:hypothetical protein